jgi:hypothetical protein
VQQLVERHRALPVLLQREEAGRDDDRRPAQAEGGGPGGAIGDDQAGAGPGENAPWGKDAWVVAACPNDQSTDPGAVPPRGPNRAAGGVHEEGVVHEQG